MAELEARQEELNTAAARYSAVKLWLATFKEHIESGEILNPDDDVVMKALVERIIVRDTGINIELKCGASIEQEYVK